ncbi:MAG TPA: helix-turn-helix domain-containing protein [Pseudonocardiaceae bacterium]
MPRPERPLDPAAGPIQAFAAQLRALREAAGRPKYLQMARATGRSRTALAEAAGGDHLPTWETVDAYVRACGADPADWLPRWERVHEAQHPRPTPTRLTLPRPAAAPATPADAPVADPVVHPAVAGSVAAAGGPPCTGGVPARSAASPPVRLVPARPVASAVRRRPAGRRERAGTAAPRWRTASNRPGAVAAQPARLVVGRAEVVGLVMVLAVLAVLSGVATASVLLGRVTMTGRPPAVDPRSTSVIVVVPDPVPLHLRPVAGCPEQGCTVPNTELHLGSQVEVFCHVVGDSVSERPGANVDNDPLRRAGEFSGWYGTRLVTGGIGYLPEAYVAPEQRHGLGLPTCPPWTALDSR